MKEILITVLFFISCCCINAQRLGFDLSSASIVDIGGNYYCQVEVQMKANTAGGMHTRGMVYLDYNSSAFGTNIAQTGSVSFQQEELLDSPSYELVNVTDNRDSTIAITWGPLAFSNLIEVPVNYHPLLLVNLPIVDTSEPIHVCLNGGLMNGQGFKMDVTGAEAIFLNPSVYTNVCQTVLPTDCTSPRPLGKEIISGNVVRLNWLDILGVEKYKVRYREIGTGTWTEVNANVNIRFLNNLTPNTAYEYSIKTVCASGNSTWSFNDSFTTLGTVCNFPATTSINNLTATSATINWSTLPDDTKYKFRYKEFAQGWSDVYVNTNSYTLMGLMPSTIHKYKVKSKCPDGWTNWSPKYSFTTPASLVSGQELRKHDANISFRVFPNPAKDKLNIESDILIVDITIYDLSGRLIQQMFANDFNSTMNISTIEQGIYFATTTFIDGSKVIQKIMVL